MSILERRVEVIKTKSRRRKVLKKTTEEKNINKIITQVLRYL